MGAYLSAPVTDKESENGAGPLCQFGLSSMQGWRRSQEDAHVAKTDLPGDIAMFAVFDGHGGTEVSKFCAQNMPDQIKKLKEFNGNEYGKSLVNVFHLMDDMLREPANREQIKRLRAKEDAEEQDVEESGPDVARAELFQKLLSLRKLMDGGQGGGSQGGAAGAAPEVPTVCKLPEHDIQAGCTAVVCLLTKTQVIVANAGDSRAVLCRGGRAVPLSFDHKPASPTERRRIEAAGGFVHETSGQHRVNGNLNLSRAIGDLKYKGDPKIHPRDQIITAEPDIMCEQRTKDDEFIVLACDGVWDVMTNQECVDFVRERIRGGRGASTTSAIAEEVLDHCLSKDPRDSQGIGCDNMTMIIVKLEPVG